MVRLSVSRRPCPGMNFRTLNFYTFVFRTTQYSRFSYDTIKFLAKTVQQCSMDPVTHTGSRCYHRYFALLSTLARPKPHQCACRMQNDEQLHRSGPSNIWRYRYQCLVAVYAIVTASAYLRVHRQPYNFAVKTEQYETIFKGTTLAAAVAGIAMSDRKTRDSKRQ